MSFAFAIVVAAHSYGQELAQSESATKKKTPSIDEFLLFFPSKFPTGNWNPKDLHFQDVFFAAEDKTKLHGWYCPADDPRAVVLVLHGNAGHVATRAPWLRYLQSRARVSVFMFDYRGYGRSEGTPTVDGAIQDAMAARSRLRELADIKDSEMLLMGESLGGAIVVQLAAKSPPQGLILQSTFLLTSRGCRRSLSEPILACSAKQTGLGGEDRRVLRPAAPKSRNGGSNDSILVG